MRVRKVVLVVVWVASVRTVVVGALGVELVFVAVLSEDVDFAVALALVLLLVLLLVVVVSLALAVVRTKAKRVRSVGSFMVACCRWGFEYESEHFREGDGESRFCAVDGVTKGMFCLSFFFKKT